MPTVVEIDPKMIVLRQVYLRLNDDCQAPVIARLARCEQPKATGQLTYSQ